MCVVHEHFGLTYGSRLIAMPLCRYMCNTHVLVSLVVVVAVAIVCTHVCPVSHQLCRRHVLKISLEAMYKDRTCHMCHTVLRSNLRSNADHVFGDLRSCLSILKTHNNPQAVPGNGEQILGFHSSPGQLADYDFLHVVHDYKHRGHHTGYRSNSCRA